MWKFPRLNLHHSSGSSCHSDNTGSLNPLCHRRTPILSPVPYSLLCSSLAPSGLVLCVKKIKSRSSLVAQGLRIWCCHYCGCGYSCDLGSIPGPGTYAGKSMVLSRYLLTQWRIWQPRANLKKFFLAVTQPQLIRTICIGPVPFFKVMLIKMLTPNLTSLFLCYFCGFSLCFGGVFGHNYSMWKLLGSNLRHSCSLCHCCSNARSLTCCATWILLFLSVFLLH